MRSNTTLAKIIAGKSARDGRDKKLWSLLPAKDAPYDYDKLSKAETDALVEALADGFGDVLVDRGGCFFVLFGFAFRPQFEVGFPLAIELDDGGRPFSS